MCVICASLKGHRQPTKDELVAMFRSNYDGAGFMYCDGEKVNIVKGFLNIDDFIDTVESFGFSDDDAVVYHCRIATHGVVDSTMTQPFPVTGNDFMLTKEIVSSDYGVAHNGIIPDIAISHSKLSDTAIFVRDYLSHILTCDEDFIDARLDSYIIGKIGQSKLAIMNGQGEVRLFGHFINDGGLLLSNQIYKRYCKSVTR